MPFNVDQSSNNPIYQVLSQEENLLQIELNQLGEKLQTFGSSIPAQSQSAFDEMQTTYEKVSRHYQEVQASIGEACTNEGNAEIIGLFLVFSDQLHPLWEKITEIFQVVSIQWNEHSQAQKVEVNTAPHVELDMTQEFQQLAEEINRVSEASRQPQDAARNAVGIWMKALNVDLTNLERIKKLADWLPELAKAIEGKRRFRPETVSSAVSSEVTSQISTWAKTCSQQDVMKVIERLPEELRQSIHESLIFQYRQNAQQFQTIIENIKSPITLEQAKTMGMVIAGIEGFSVYLPAESKQKIWNEIFPQGWENGVIEKLSNKDLVILQKTQEFPARYRACFALHETETELLDDGMQQYANDSGIFPFLCKLQKCLSEMKLAEKESEESENPLLFGYRKILMHLAEKVFEKRKDVCLVTLLLLEANFRENQIAEIPEFQQLISAIVELHELKESPIATLENYVQTLQDVEGTIKRVKADYLTSENPLVLMLRALLGDVVLGYYSKQNEDLNIEENAEVLFELKRLLQVIPLQIGLEPVKLAIDPEVEDPTPGQLAVHQERLQRFGLDL